MSTKMKTYDPGMPVIFTHVPKCAGSSFIRLLRQWFGPKYHKLNQDETQDILLPRISTRDEDGNWDQSIKCIHGHFDNGRGYGLPYYYPEIDQYFTILRDPFDIVVSMFFFCKGRSLEGKFWYRGEQVNILDEFPTVEHYLREYPYWLYNHMPQDVTIQNLRDRLAKHFIYIGIQEDLQTSIRMLARIFNQKEIELPRFNESNYDEPVPEWMRSRFYYDYPLLYEIYQFAKENYKNTSCLDAVPEETDSPASSLNFSNMSSDTGQQNGVMTDSKKPANEKSSPTESTSVAEHAE